ncbi:unnamed protein product [Amoebophrya sp. A25]|nr:unnamed protein product [Amoebophrya sp. A25]|eukprot:GSA25T00010516001.1
MTLSTAVQTYDAEAKARFPHLVFVYGTLKTGFFNHGAVMMTQADTWQQISSAATIQRNHEADHFFVDIYYTPYLVLGASPQDSNQGEVENEVPDGGKDVGNANDAKVVRGELFAVNEEMLASLDDLEDVKFGRYTRSEVLVSIPSGENFFSCFVYHLRAERISAELLDQVEHIEEYQKEEHEKRYVHREDRDPDKYVEKWGVYLEGGALLGGNGLEVERSEKGNASQGFA